MIKAWPTLTVISNGDYKEESWLDTHISGPLYAPQSSLPNLPVPTLSQTMSTFLPTALALAKTEEEREGVRRDCREFLKEGGKLQKRLQSRSTSNPNSSWLQEWWNKLGYLIPRDPVPVNVSYFFQFADDAGVSDGVQRAAGLLVSTAIFRRRVITGELPMEVVGRGKTNLCSTAWKYMFNACRVPKKGADEYHLHDPSLHRHVAVVRRNQWFAVEFVDVHHNPLPVGVIEARLRDVVARADARVTDAPGIGVCTGGERDQWADDRGEVFKVHTGAREGVGIIETAAIVVCLDEVEKVSDGCVSEGLWHGGEGERGNRWFDKPVQVIVTDNGKAGILGEHSMMDGMPMVRYADYLVKHNYDVNRDVASLVGWKEPDGVGVESCFTPECVEAMANSSKLARIVGLANDAFNDLVGAQELNTRTFRGYGSGVIKGGQMSPDAYVQVVLQLATTRLFGESVGTYEASQVRAFKHGRTETTRSCSVETVKFCEAMGRRVDGGGEREEERKRRLGLFRNAVGGHVGYLKKAAKGMGVDRHLFGLKMLLKPREKVPALFNNPLFNKSKYWRVSTSHLTHPEFQNWGWGEVVPDGVGIAYSIHPDRCVFNVTARKETGYSRRLSHLIEEAMMEVWDMMVREERGGSKL